MTRRFYGFNDPETVRSHIAQINTWNDALQLWADIRASGTNLASMQAGKPGILALDYAEGLGPFKRHIFATSQAIAKYGPFDDLDVTVSEI